MKKCTLLGQLHNNFFRTENEAHLKLLLRHYGTLP